MRYNTRLQHREKDQIRIFVLSPGSGEEPLRGTLVTNHVSSAPSYEAISYAWGDSTLSAGVICDDRALKVTESARSALTCLRLPDRQRRLWIDGICINQEDSGERGHQVKLMKAVYSNAEQVLVWLGDGGQTSAVAVAIFERLARESKDFGKSNEPADLERLFSSVTDLPLAIIAVEKLLQGPWVRRLWVVQEVQLASSVIFFYGSCMFSPSTLALAVGCLQRAYAATLASHGDELGPWGNILSMTLTHWAWLLYFSHDTGYSDRYALGKLLFQTSLHLCSDTLDRLYAILGLLEPLFVRTVSVDYDSPPSTVLRTFLLTEIQRSKSLDILTYRDPRSRLTEMRMESRGPSWLFDWLNCFPSITSFRGKNSAYFEGLIEQTPRLQVSKCGTVISLKGRIVDKIAKLGPLPTVTIRKGNRGGLVGIIAGMYDMVEDCNGNGVAPGMRSVTKSPHEHLLRVIYTSPGVYECSHWPVIGSVEDFDQLQRCQIALGGIHRAEEWSMKERYPRNLGFQLLNYRFCKTSKGLFGFLYLSSPEKATVSHYCVEVLRRSSSDQSTRGTLLWLVRAMCTA